MWYLNFCTPFDNLYTFNRKVLVANLLLIIIIYFVLKCAHDCKFAVTLPDQEKVQGNPLDKVADSQSAHQVKFLQERVSSNNDEQQQAETKKNGEEPQQQSGEQVKKQQTEKEIPTYNKVIGAFGSIFCCCQRFPFPVRQFEDYFTIMFGHHAVGVIFSAIYAPYLAQIICTYVYTLFGIIYLCFWYFNFSKLTKFMWALMCVINIFLMQSGLIGLGITDWDDINSICYSNEFS